MHTFIVALLQLLPTGSLAGNLKKGLAAYRRPKKYHLLVEESIQPPFVRPDYRP